jgi:hypothetical protein
MTPQTMTPQTMTPQTMTDEIMKAVKPTGETKCLRLLCLLPIGLLFSSCGTMGQTPVPLNTAIVQTAKELAVAADALEHPERISGLTPNQRRWLAIVRKSYDAGTVKVTYSVTQNENGTLQVSFPPSTVLGFGVDRSRSNTIEVEFPRRSKE